MKIVSKFLLLAVFALALVGCDNSKTTTTATAKSNSKFSLISDNCQLIGAINIDDIAKVESVKKLVQENQSIPYYKEIRAAGLGIENLSALYFGAEIPTDPNQAALQSEGVFLLISKSKVNLPDFIALAEKNNNIKFKTETLGSKQAYLITDASNLNPPTYIVQLSDTIIAVGTQKEATSTISLFDNGGKSVLDNTALMSVANNTENKDMLWFAASVPKETNENNDPNSPDINDIFLAMNYANNTLSMSGKAVCATEQDVQKIMMPAQILTSMAVMSSNNTIKPADLVLKADKNIFTINVNLSEAALKYMAEKSAQQIQAAAPVVAEEVVTEEIVPDTSASTTPVPPKAAPAVKADSVQAQPAPIVAEEVITEEALPDTSSLTSAPAIEEEAVVVEEEAPDTSVATPAPVAPISADVK